MDRCEDQLDNLLNTLQLVRDEPALHTPAIEVQSQVIVKLGNQLQTDIDNLAVHLGKSKLISTLTLL